MRSPAMSPVLAGFGSAEISSGGSAGTRRGQPHRSAFASNRFAHGATKKTCSCHFAWCDGLKHAAVRGKHTMTSALGGILGARSVMKLGCVILALGFGFQRVEAQPAQVILLRHAEKLDDSNPHLSARGKQRARALVGFLTKTPTLTQNGLPVALFVPRLTHNRTSVRPQETLEPLAADLKLPISRPYPAKTYKELARAILKNPEYKEKTVVICWVHDYLPGLAESFGVNAKSAIWKSQDYDHVWSITFKDGEARLAILPQRLLSGDSRL